MDNTKYVKIIAIIALVVIAVTMILVDKSTTLAALLFGFPIYFLATAKE